MATTKWALDPTHSELQFKVKHLMISTVSGEFTSYEGAVETQGDSFAGASITFSAINWSESKALSTKVIALLSTTLSD